MKAQANGTVTDMKIGETLKRVSLLYVLLFPLLVQPTSALGNSTKFNTCAQMKKQYRFGVALNLRVAGDYPAEISKLIYQRNKGLDYDYDGIVCENELLQNSLNPNTRSTTTTSIQGVSVTTVVPLPISPQYVPFRNGGSVTLRGGVAYQIYACATGQNGTTYLDVLSIKTGWTQKATGRSELDATRCPNPSLRYMWTFGWIVTETPGEISKFILRGFTGVLEMTVVISN